MRSVLSVALVAAMFAGCASSASTAAKPAAPEAPVAAPPAPPEAPEDTTTQPQPSEEPVNLLADLPEGWMAAPWQMLPPHVAAVYRKIAGPRIVILRMATEKRSAKAQATALCAQLPVDNEGSVTTGAVSVSADGRTAGCAVTPTEKDGVGGSATVLHFGKDNDVQLKAYAMWGGGPTAPAAVEAAAILKSIRVDPVPRPAPEPEPATPDNEGAPAEGDAPEAGNGT